MDIWKTAKEVLGVVAPTIGTALGGPMGGVAARTLATSLLGKSDATEQEIISAVTGASPEQLAMLKNAELEFQTEMKKLDIDLASINMKDRDSARRRQAEMGYHVPSLLAIMTLISFFGYIGAVTFGRWYDADIGFINIAVGWLGGTASTVVAYYFGSSADNSLKKEKT